jgi:hypothetical protein
VVTLLLPADNGQVQSAFAHEKIQDMQAISAASPLISPGTNDVRLLLVREML